MNIMNREEFLTTLVKIEWVERSNCYGCYPFPLFVLDSKNKRILSALDCGGDVKSCYKIVDSYIKKEAKEIFFGLDFPKGGDIQNDFVAIFSIIKKQISICALPYNSVNGECYSIINESSHLENILREYKTVTSNE